MKHRQLQKNDQIRKFWPMTTVPSQRPISEAGDRWESWASPFRSRALSLDSDYHTVFSVANKLRIWCDLCPHFSITYSGSLSSCHPLDYFTIQEQLSQAIRAHVVEGVAIDQHEIVSMTHELAHRGHEKRCCRKKRVPKMIALSASQGVPGSPMAVRGM